MKAIRFHQVGGPEVLSYEDVPLAEPGPGEVRIRHSAVALNFRDILVRRGQHSAKLPSGLGTESAGVIEAIGPGVSELKPGDRVVTVSRPDCACAEARNAPAARVLKLPDEIDDRTAASMMVRGLTARYLLKATYAVQPGDTIVIHAAAGGVGLIMSQWAKHLGATVIGTVGSQEKAAEAKAHGCDHPILYREEDFAARTREITKGEGVPVVYDSVGKDTFAKSLDCLRPFGVMALFGQSSGPVPPVDLGVLAQKGSLYVTRPTLMTYVAKRADLDWAARELFEVVGSGKVKIEINQTYPLAETAQAHRDLEARKTTGSTLLLP
jgi:NADPH:quinone reductase